MDEEDPVAVTLSLGQWRTVGAHLEVGVWREVNPILASLYLQVNTQIIAANERAAGAAEAAQIAAAEAELHVPGAGSANREPRGTVQPDDA